MQHFVVPGGRGAALSARACVHNTPTKAVAPHNAMQTMPLRCIVEAADGLKGAG